MAGKVIGRYTIGDKLDKGGTAVVYSAFCDNRKNVCKITDGKYCDGVKKEYEILRCLKHDNVVAVFDFISCNKIVAMAMEQVPCGDLHDSVIRHWPTTTDTRRKYTAQVISAVDHIHTMGIAHCDLKLENMLINTNGDIKIIDFGSALRVSDATYEDFAYIATTPEYLPPEIFCATAGEGYDIRAIDEWSVGVVLFILLTGRFPFGEVDQSRIAKYIKKMRTASSFQLKQSEEMFIYFEKDYLEIVRGLLCFDPDKRLPVSKVLQMGFLKKSDDLLEIDDVIDKEFESIFDEL